MPNSPKVPAEVEESSIVSKFVPKSVFSSRQCAIGVREWWRPLNEYLRQIRTQWSVGCAATHGDREAPGEDETRAVTELPRIDSQQCARQSDQTSAPHHCPGCHARVLIDWCGPEVVRRATSSAFDLLRKHERHARSLTQAESAIRSACFRLCFPDAHVLGNQIALQARSISHAYLEIAAQHF